MSNNAIRIYGEPGTLYSRCGGVFGIAAFVDRCMDRWMADKMLNDNAKVARWHASAQRPGFKFLVVQIVCSLTGGPQHYTGRPMDEAHKHLNISEQEWDRFMEIFNEVCGEFGLPSEDTDDLNALMISMMDECVVMPGERVPRDPGPMRPGGNALYAKCGGVYPLALFADRLVDALLHDERVAIPTDGTKRNEASLKYLVTEVICHLAKGPEAITCAQAEETRLLVPKAAWPIVLLTARLAADHLNEREREALLTLVEKHKAAFVDPHSRDGPLPGGAAARRAAAVKSKQDASWDGGKKLLSAAVINARHAAGGASVAARKRVYGDPRTLYGKGGGVFGLAKVSHFLMEAWMADKTLNDNAMVARWHESQQRPGFVFLVTQIMGYMTGGPQRYTGRPLDEAHAHLGISPREWRRFMQIADETCARIAVPAAARRELLEILEGFEQQCVLPPGKAPPADPGAPRPHPSSLGSAFHRLGGVYPIAQFADRLVAALAARADVGVRFDAIDDPNGRRHAPGVTYMLTELLCSAAGGPEVVTARGFEEAKLGVPAESWPAFCACAAQVASLFPTAHHRAMILSLLTDLQPELCVGLDEQMDVAEGNGRASPAAAIEAAGFERFDAVAALARSDNDPERALELLMTGWRPEGAAAEAAAAALAAPAAGKCPFGFGAAAGAPSAAPPAGMMTCPFAAKGGPLPPGHPPIPDMIPDMMEFDEPAPAAAPPGLPPAMVETVKVMAERGGQSAAAIAAMLKLDVTAVEAALHAGEELANAAGKVVGDPMQLRLDALLEEGEELCCPVTLTLLLDPVKAPDGFVYERSAAEALCDGGKGFVSPMTREQLPAAFAPAVEMRERTAAFRRERTEAMLVFAAEAAPTHANMAMGIVDRASEYLAAMAPEAVALLSVPTARACNAILAAAKTPDNPAGLWEAKPQQLRRVHALRQQASAGGGADLRQLTCLVCFDEYPALKGLECGPADGGAGGSSDERHFVCEECLAGHVASSVDAESIELFRQRGGVCCVHPECKHPPFSDKCLARALPAETFELYSKAKERVAEQRINAELEVGFQQRLQVERERAGGHAEREATKEHICQKILTPACPRCGQAFVDFSGCMALNCSRAGCGCGFCALCGEDCGNDAHAHVGRGCPMAQQLGVKSGEFYLNDDTYEAVSARARGIRLKAYLETLTEARKQHALADCARELADLGLDPAEFGAANAEAPKRGREQPRQQPRRAARRDGLLGWLG